MKTKLNRRRFLRCMAGGVGTLMGLPLLEGMFSTDRAFAQASQLHPKFFSFYLPNGVIQDNWWPATGSGPNFSLMGSSLEALEPHKDSISLFKGLRNAGSFDGGGNAHMRAISAFLTGKPIANDQVARHEVSFDQALAEHYKATAPTPIASLELAGNTKIDPPNNASYNNDLKNALTFDSNGNILPTTTDLRAVYDRLFAGYTPGGADADARRRLAIKNSVIDYVKEERATVERHLGAGDAQRIDQYFTAIRELERRLEAFENDQASCDLEAAEQPKSYNDANDNHFIGEHSRLTSKMVALAFACDTTRVVTYMSSGEASKTRYPEIGLDIVFHDQISHNQAGFKNQHAEIDAYHAALVSTMLDEFEATPHGDGTLLDNTCVLMGSGLGNGDAHSMYNIAMLVAGRFGNINPGQFYDDLNGRTHAEVLNALRVEFGLPTTLFPELEGGILDMT